MSLNETTEETWVFFHASSGSSTQIPVVQQFQTVGDLNLLKMLSLIPDNLDCAGKSMMYLDPEGHMTLFHKPNEQCVIPHFTYRGNKVTNHLEIGTMKNNVTVCSTVQCIWSWRLQNAETRYKRTFMLSVRPINYFHSLYSFLVVICN